MKSKATVETPAPAIAELQQKRQLTSDIMKGSAAMRNERYLPKYPGESDPDYKARIARTFLDNFVDLAISKAVGKIFSKPIKLEDVPPEIEAINENIDRQGRALNPFIMDIAEQAFQDGISYVMVDMPAVDGIRTQSEERQLGIRPYAIHVKPCHVLELLSEMVGGIDTLVRVRIKEEIMVPVAGLWEYEEIEQVRVWYNEGGVVRWELWREKEKEEEWYLFEEGLTTFKSIYLVPFYTNRIGYMLGEPPFSNIAESTLEHFQLKSDYQAALEMVCFGSYWATGVDPDFQFKVGARQGTSISNPDAKIGILETTGAAVTLSLDAIKAVEARIEVAGVDLRVENGGDVSATAAAIDSEDTNAALKAIANGFADSCKLMFQYISEIMGIENTVECECNTDFGERKGSDAGLTSIDKARALGDISKEGYLNILRWRGELPAEFDILEDIEKSDQEAPDLMNVGVE